MAQKEDARAIQQAIYSLPLKYREVLVLRVSTAPASN
jgi:DNA-directed RNA polymerase specialized sigma24 family protein